jgi:hypothetical protein
MIANGVQFTQTTDRGYSNGLWKDAPDLAILKINPTLGWYIDDDFTDFPLAGVQTTEIGHGKYKVFCTTAGKVEPVSTVNSVVKPGGVLSMLADSDNDSASIAQAYPTFFLSGDPATSGKLWMEARMAISSIANNGIGFMLGLAETTLWTLATGVPFNGGDAITNSASFIGFRKEEDGLGVLDTVYSDRATSFTNIGDAASSMLANTFIKLGMKYDPTNAAACVTFWVNGTQLTTVLSRAALVAMTNLDANALGIIFAMVADSGGTAIRPYIDMWRVIQVPVTNAS